jgi:hypothetical protein
VLPDEKAVTAAAFLRRAVAFYHRYGIHVEAVLTENGAAYIAVVHAIACRRLRIKHLRTRPYRPQTNGKAERFIRTLLTGCGDIGAAAVNAGFGFGQQGTSAGRFYDFPQPPMAPPIAIESTNPR